MFNVAERIKPAPACGVIDLSEAEKRVYNGGGWKLALFKQGILTEFFSPMEVECLPDVDEMISDALEAATQWLQAKMPQGEVWLVMCSGYQLCEPRRISFNDTSVAHMARVFAEQLRDDDT